MLMVGPRRWRNMNKNNKKRNCTEQRTWSSCALRFMISLDRCTRWGPYYLACFKRFGKHVSQEHWWKGAMKKNELFMAKWCPDVLRRFEPPWEVTSFKSSEAVCRIALPRMRFSKFEMEPDKAMDSVWTHEMPRGVRLFFLFDLFKKTRCWICASHTSSC